MTRLADIRRHPAYVFDVAFWNTVRLFHFGELDFGVANLRDTGIPKGPAVASVQKKLAVMP